MMASHRPRSWQDRDAPSARAAWRASSAALPVPPDVTVARSLDPHASSCTDPYSRYSRTLSPAGGRITASLAPLGRCAWRA
jgi:hypothetical protein